MMLLKIILGIFVLISSISCGNKGYFSTIIAYNHDSIYFNRTFLKENFPQIGDEDFFKQAITYNTWVENYNKENHKIKFTHVIGVSETDWAYKCSITIDSNSNYNHELENIE